MIWLLIKLIFLTYIIVVAYISASQEEMVLSGIGDWARKKDEEGHKYFKILTCPWCAPSLFSILSFLAAWRLDLFYFFDGRLLILYFLTVCGASVASGLTWSFYEMINAKKDYYKSLVQYEDES